MNIHDRRPFAQRAVICMHRPVQGKYAAKAAHGSRDEQGKKFSLLDHVGQGVCILLPDCK